MRRGTKYLLLALIMVSFAIFMPPKVAANESIEVNMWEAYYADLDGDGAADDIIVKFNLTTPFNESEYTIELYCTLTLPSGVQYVHEVAVVTDGSCTITQYWYDSASESGWYSYSVYAYSLTSSLDPGFSEIVFDPPGGDPGEPLVDTTIVDTNESQG